MLLSASTLDCDDSRVNFSREIELQPLNAVKRRPMSGANCSNSTSSTVSMFLVFTCSHRDLISRSNLVSSRHTIQEFNMAKRIQSPKAHKILNCVSANIDSSVQTHHKYMMN